MRAACDVNHERLFFLVGTFYRFFDYKYILKISFILRRSILYFQYFI